MHMFCCLALLSAWTLTWIEPVQAVPPPRDGDIRAVYFELRKETEVWLTLEPKSAAGKPAPPGMTVTFTVRFPGKQPTIQRPDIEVRAYAGLLWAPRVQLWFVLDGSDKIDLAAQGNMITLSTGSVSDYLPAMIPPDTLKQIADAKRVEGNALGVAFELTASQRRALRTFYDRVVSGDPAQWPR